MDRGSTQHGPRIDDAMADEVDAITRGAPLESRRHEERELEPPANGEPTPDSLITGSAAQRAVELRSEIARHLRPSSFPADIATLLRVAGQERAPDEVLAALARLPADQEFATTADVWEALGIETAGRAVAPVEAPPEPDVEPEPETEPESEPERAPGSHGDDAAPAPSLVTLGRDAVAESLDLAARVLQRCAHRIRERDDS